MGQSDCTRTKKNTPSFIKQFEKKKEPQKRRIWLFYCGYKTRGEDGLKVTGAPGSKDNRKQAGNLKTWFSQDQFYNQARVSSVVFVAPATLLLSVALFQKQRTI